MSKALEALARLESALANPQMEAIALKDHETKILKTLAQAIAAGCAEIEQELEEEFEDFDEVQALVTAALKLLLTQDRSILRTALRKFERTGSAQTRAQFRRTLGAK